MCFSSTSVSEKYAQVQQNPILPPTTFFFWCKNSKKVSRGFLSIQVAFKPDLLSRVGPANLQTLLHSCRLSYRDRLSASDMLQVRKVMEHVYEKIINLDNESQTTSSTANDKPGEQEKEEDMAMLAEEKIELMCQDQVWTALPF